MVFKTILVMRFTLGESKSGREKISFENGHFNT